MINLAANEKLGSPFQYLELPWWYGIFQVVNWLLKVKGLYFDEDYRSSFWRSRLFVINLVLFLVGFEFQCALDGWSCTLVVVSLWMYTFFSYLSSRLLNWYDSPQLQWDLLSFHQWPIVFVRILLCQGDYCWSLMLWPKESCCSPELVCQCSHTSSAPLLSMWDSHPKWIVDSILYGISNRLNYI